MAIEREIPKDICKYESKLIGPLTTRQICCSVPAFVLSIGLYFLLKETALPQDVKVILCILAAAPLLLCGFYKPLGIPLERFVKMTFNTMVLSPTKRVYKINNNFWYMNDVGAEVKKKQNKKKDKDDTYKSKDKSLKAYK